MAKHSKRQNDNKHDKQQNIKQNCKKLNNTKPDYKSNIFVGIALILRNLISY